MRVIWALALYLLCWSGGGLAQQSEALGLSNYEHGRVIMQDEKLRVDDYTLALGPYRKSKSRWVMGASRRLEGLLSRRTVEIDSGFSAEEAFAYYRLQLEAKQARQLYSCEGRECGSSNSWANLHFRIKQLYGYDQHQHYGAYLLDVDGQQWVVALYGVTRGNRRAYLHLDHLRLTAESSLDAPSAATVPSDSSAGLLSSELLLSELKSRGFVPLVHFSQHRGVTAFDRSELSRWAGLLQENTDLRLALVVHDFQAADDTAAGKARALGYAHQLKSKLEALGVAEQQLLAQGVGSLVPSKRQRGDLLLELVLQPLP